MNLTSSINVGTPDMKKGFVGSLSSVLRPTVAELSRRKANFVALSTVQITPILVDIDANDSSGYSGCVSSRDFLEATIHDYLMHLNSPPLNQHDCRN
jgi:hypothetical protein